MGNNNSHIDDSLPNYDPNDEINTPENELNLSPFTYINFGLYHSSLKLDQFYPKIVLFKIEDQAMYSDAITRRYALNPHFIRNREKELDVPVDKFSKHANATSIGNLAFITIHNGADSKWGIYYSKVINYMKFNYF